MQGEGRQWLMVTVKSLTHTRQPKVPSVPTQHYQLVLENHSIHNHLNIDEHFRHNYEYVYQLWPTKPADRELLRIQLYEGVPSGGRDAMVKRG
jgi:hypothetical protein